MGTRVYVGRLPYDVRERDIEKFFKGYGRIREVLMKDGFAFVVSIFSKSIPDIDRFFSRNSMTTVMLMTQFMN